MSRGVSIDTIDINGGEEMDEFKSIVSYQTSEYGSVKVKLAEMLDKKAITRNRLSTLTGINYDIITRYYKAENIEMVDLNFLAKVCFVLDCRIEDLLEYEKP